MLAYVDANSAGVNTISPRAGGTSQTPIDNLQPSFAVNFIIKA